MSIKLSLSLSGAAEQTFNELCDKMDDSQKQVILDALALYDFAVKEILAGRLVGSVDPTTNNFMEVNTQMLGELKDRK